MEYIKIDPVEELLKGLEIVHGKAYADNMRMSLARATTGIQLDEKIPGTPAYRLAELEEWAKQEFWFSSESQFENRTVEDILFTGVRELKNANLEFLENEMYLRQELNITMEKSVSIINAIKELKEENKKLAKEIKRIKRKPRYRRY